MRGLAILLLAIAAGCGDEENSGDGSDSDSDIDADSDSDTDVDTDSDSDSDSDGDTDADTDSDTDTGTGKSCDLPEDAGTWATFAADFLTTYCGDCHNDDARGVDRDFHVYDDVVTDSNAIRCGVTPRDCPQPSCGDEMPAGQFPIGDGPYPSRDDRLRIVAWVEAGLPE